jgi:integrase
MATVREVILPLEKKKDETWNVKIRVNHKGKNFYIKTQHFIGSNQIRKDHSIKDPIILKLMNPVLDDYREKISELGSKLELYNVRELADFLIAGEPITADEINIISFGINRIEELRAANRDASASNMQTVVNSLIDYFKSAIVPITAIRAKFLQTYEKYLRTEREITRLDQFKVPYKRTVQGLSDTGLHNHMRDLRILFNNAVDFYNDEDLENIVIKHYPFKKYKLVQVTEKIKKKLTVAQVRKIRDCVVQPGSRMELAKDLFMLSFYLCGMNAVDLFKLEAGSIDLDRVDYNRSKTQSRRKDKAFISIDIPEIAEPLYAKYAGTLQLRYASHKTLDRALSIGMRAIVKLLNIPELEFYDARHAFGDWARNICRFSKDDVGLALNHKDQSNSITDFYVSKSWAIIDEVQKK